MLLIKNGYVKTMAGPDIPDGCVLIGDDGKITAVGANLSAPEKCPNSPPGKNIPGNALS